MTDDNVTRLPKPGVVFDFDSLVRDPKDIKEPFVALVREREITFSDPAELPWQDLAAIVIPSDLFSVALSSDDRRWLRDTEMAGWKFNELMKAYYEHYDFEEKIRAAKRQAAAQGLG